MSVEISRIRLDGGTQSRAAINDAVVADYAEAMANPDTVFPPVVVYFDGKDYWLADGFHRVAAWSQIGRTDIPAEVRQGDRRRAILHSVAANAVHGLRRSNDDKRRAVMTLLEDTEWSKWSARDIAKQCGVSHDFAARLKREMSSDDSEPRTYTTKHGIQATMQTANIGAGSKPDQHRLIAPTKPEGAASAGEPQDVPAPAVPLAPPPPPADQEPVDPETAKVRRELAKLTPDAVVDEVIGLRATLAEVRAKAAKQKVELDAAKAQLADHRADDKDEVITRLTASLKNAENAKWREAEKAAAALRQVHALQKRVAELENMGIALN
ncbi:hypothetical protein [Falsirhodobacter halotolerans]|uniref:hypothetical protein n=1 Tax=Falsirhodobacter halotolerans TaxID=1146892 RepID=UPI001FD25BDD|nr:hypothetical protein [Falsirhodobacter halotolerans]MCJ8138584.1 hypothetical protein [Falsirhodobacter halotolerans]